MSEGYVYFITDGEAVKIGFSKDPHSRLRDMQTASPRELELLHSMPGSLETEAKLHDRFRDLQIRGEWFAFDGALAKMLPSLPPAAPAPVACCRPGWQRGLLSMYQGVLHAAAIGPRHIVLPANHCECGVEEQRLALAWMLVPEMWDDAIDYVDHFLNWAHPEILAIRDDTVKLVYLACEDDPFVPIDCAHQPIIEMVDIFDYYLPHFEVQVWVSPPFRGQEPRRVPLPHLCKTRVGEWRVPEDDLPAMVRTYVGSLPIRDTDDPEKAYALADVFMRQRLGIDAQ